MLSTPLSPACQGPVPRDSGFAMAGYWVWCGSVIRAEDGRYHMFASRWPRDITFHPGWMTDSEVVRAVSDTPEGPYTFAEVVLPRRGAEWWDGRSTHNPSITRCGSTYILFYTGSTHPLDDAPRGTMFATSDPRCIAARAGKRIGVATAPAVTGPWTRLDQPVLETRPASFYSHLTSNPAPVVHADGSVTLIFKSRRYVGNGHGPMTLGLARADHWLGPYRVTGDAPLFGPDRFAELEDPFLWHNGENFELVAKDMGSTLTGEHHAGIHALSRDAEHWELARPAQAYSRTITWSDGTVQTMGQLERPFLLRDPASGLPTHLFAATMDGPGGFNNATRSWNLCVPLSLP
jgi:hypothetical protein